MTVREMRPHIASPSRSTQKSGTITTWTNSDPTRHSAITTLNARIVSFPIHTPPSINEINLSIVVRYRKLVDVLRSRGVHSDWRKACRVCKNAVYECSD